MFLNLSCKIAVCTINERKFGFLTYRAKYCFALESLTNASGFMAPKAPKSLAVRFLVQRKNTI
jgi:hypothetical protein